MPTRATRTIAAREQGTSAARKDKSSYAKSAWSIIFPHHVIKTEPGPLELISVIKKGLPGNTIGDVAEIFGIQKTALYTLLNMKPKTAQRARDKAALSVDTSDHIVQLIKVLSRCTEVFKSDEKATRWLNTPNHALGGETPLTLMDTIEGIGLVQDTVTRIEYGVFA